MRNTWGGIAVLAMLAVAACGGGDGQNEERRAQSPQGSGQDAAPAAATVTLTGCVEAAPGTNQYVLRNVRFEPRSAGDAQAQTTTGGGHGITEGAWVKLDSAGQDLNSVLGQRVQLTGTIADSGQNTIGTAGTSGVQTPSGDKSQAGGKGDSDDRQRAEMGRMARESMADGTAAQVRVQQVQGTGDRCTPLDSKDRK